MILGLSILNSVSNYQGSLGNIRTEFKISVWQLKQLEAYSLDLLPLTTLGLK